VPALYEYGAESILGTAEHGPRRPPAKRAEFQGTAVTNSLVALRKLIIIAAVRVSPKFVLRGFWFRPECGLDRGRLRARRLLSKAWALLRRTAQFALLQRSIAELVDC